MDIKICAPSYHRPNAVDTFKYIPSCRLYVSNEELAEYKMNYPDATIIGVNPMYQGNVSRIRNYILDTEMADDCVVVIIDDDLKKIGYHEGGQQIIMNEQEIYDFIEKYSILSFDWGIKYWGININKDPLNYRCILPFSLGCYIGSPFGVHFKHDIRYDEMFSLKEDYDFTISYLNKYRKALRVNKFFYDTKQAEQVGGCAMYRNLDKEKEQIDLLIKKWGRNIVRIDNSPAGRNGLSRKIKMFDINPIISIPIRGI